VQELFIEQVSRSVLILDRPEFTQLPGSNRVSRRVVPV
jgi:hypothetical protein